MSEYTCNISGVTFETKNGWIDVKTMPQTTGFYLCAIKGFKEPKVRKCEQRINGEFSFRSNGNDITKHVTHWMPLPELPK